MSFMTGFVKSIAQKEQDRIKIMQEINNKQSGLMSAIQRELGRKDNAEQIKQSNEYRNKVFEEDIKRAAVNDEFRNKQEERIASYQTLQSENMKQNMDIANKNYDLRKQQADRLKAEYDKNNIDTKKDRQAYMDLLSISGRYDIVDYLGAGGDIKRAREMEKVLNTQAIKTKDALNKMEIEQQAQVRRATAIEAFKVLQKPNISSSQRDEAQKTLQTLISADPKVAETVKDYRYILNKPKAQFEKDAGISEYTNIASKVQSYSEALSKLQAPMDMMEKAKYDLMSVEQRRRINQEKALNIQRIKGDLVVMAEEYDKLQKNVAANNVLKMIGMYGSPEDTTSATSPPSAFKPVNIGNAQFKAGK